MAEKKDFWPTQETIKFMKALGNYPILYDIGLRDSMKGGDNTNRDDALIDLSIKFDRGVNKVRSKIKSIRSQYMREHTKRSTQSGDVAEQSKKWFGFEVMSYMENTEPFVRDFSIVYFLLTFLFGNRAQSIFFLNHYFVGPQIVNK